MSAHRLTKKADVKQHMEFARISIRRAEYVQTHIDRLVRVLETDITTLRDKQASLLNEATKAPNTIAYNHTKLEAYKKTLHGMNTKHVSSSRPQIPRREESAIERRTRLLQELADLENSPVMQGFDFDE